MHGDQVGVQGLERPNEGVLEDGLMEDLLGETSDRGRRMQGRSAAESVVELERPACLAVLMRPQPRLESFEKLQPRGLLVALVVTTV